jgi:type I restriction enzyme M protein
MERNIKAMDALARYYTQEKISQLLINKLHTEEPKRILELGIGGGSLSLAAFKRWSGARFFGADIDDNSITKLKDSLPFVEVINHSGLEHNIQIKLNIKDSSVDIALCNPPYLKHKASDIDKLLFEKVKLDSCINNKQITTDIVFLAQNLMFLKDGCELGIILPDSILTNHYFKGLRNDLLINHNVKSIIQLPDKVFNKTEARTHILIIEKNGESNHKIEVSKASFDGEITHTIYVDRSNLIQRMDFDFHYWSLGLNEKLESSLTLEDITISLKRGNKTKKYLQALNVPYFHTTSYCSNEYYLELSTTIDDFPSNLTLASPGDILIARVGKRCVGKAIMIREGYIPISDCIYRLKVQESYKNKIYEALISNQGQTWLQAYAHGVCARLISKSDLLKFKLT